LTYGIEYMQGFSWRLDGKAPRCPLRLWEGVSPVDITLVGIEKSGVTKPRNDGTRGSALYTVPIKLSARPSTLWSRLFIEAWNHPESFTTMHRPGIATVSGDTVVLNGTSLEEVEKYHLSVLKAAAVRANEGERAHEAEEAERKSREAHEAEEFRKHVDESADRIKFD